LVFSSAGALCGNYALVGFSFAVIFVFWLQACVVVYNIFKIMFVKEEAHLGLAASQALKARKAAEARAKADEDEASQEDLREKNAAAAKAANDAKKPLAMQADATETLGMQAVREQFMVIGNMDEIASNDLEEVLQNLRLRLPEADIDEIKETLDLEGIITFDLFYEWYKGFYADKKKKAAGDDAPSAPVDLSKPKKEVKEKKSRFGFGAKKDKKKVYADDKADAGGGDAFAEIERKSLAASGSAAQGDGQKAEKKGGLGWLKKKDKK
jgi:hypothetical protein